MMFAYVLLFGGGFPALVDFRLQLFSSILAVTVLGGWLVLRIARGERLPSAGIELALFLFVLSQFVAVMFSGDPRRSLPHAITWLVYVLAFFYALDLLRRGWQAELFEKCLLIVGAIGVAFALLELGRFYFSWLDVTAGLEFAPSFQQRISGILGDPNLLAAFTNLLIPLAVARAIVSRKGAGWLLSGFIFASLVVVYLTDSRGGFLGLAASLTSLFLFWILVVSDGAKKRVRHAWNYLWERKWALCLLGGLLLLVIAFVAWRMFSFEGDTTHAPALEARDIYWQAAANAFGKDPLTGEGPGMYPVYLMQIWSTPPARPYLHAHSFPFQVAAESGLLGLGALAFLVVAIGWRAWDGWRGLDHTGRARWAAAVAGLLGLCVHSLVDDFFPFAAVGVVAMLLLAFVLMQPPKGKALVLRPLWLLLPGLAAALFTGFALRAYWHADRAVDAGVEGDWPLAAAEMTAAIEADPGFPLYWLQAAYAYTRLAETDAGYTDEAIIAFQKGIAMEPYHALSAANLGALYWSIGDLDQALSQMRIATSLAQESWLVWLNRGVYEEQLGLGADARYSYAAALNWRPELTGAVFWQQSGLRQVALESFTPRPAETNRTQALEMVQEGRRLLAAGLFSEAREALRDAYELNNQEVRIYVALGELALAQGRLNEAEQYVQAAFWIQATSNQYKVEAILLGAEVARAQGDPALALQRYEAAYKGFLADTSYGWGSAGWSPYAWFVFQRRAFPEDLVAQLERADISSDIAQRLLALAEMYEEQGMGEEAQAVRQALDSYLP